MPRKSLPRVEVRSNQVAEMVPAVVPPASKSGVLRWVVMSAIVICLVGLASFLYQQNKLKMKQVAVIQQKLADTESQLAAITQNNTPNSADEQAQKLIDQVSKLIVLPADEQPTIATVADLEKLKDQPFFSQAIIGDKVLIYTVAKKAILFRPSENKIIEIAPLSTGTQDAQKSKKNNSVSSSGQAAVAGASTTKTK